jgi:cytochrome c-type biogenesis protein CcmE
VLKRKKFLIGGIIILLALIYLGYTGFSSSATYYYTVSELSGKGSSMYGQNVRVNGQVVPGSVEKKPGDLTLKFNIVEGEKSLPVAYNGIVPDAFQAGRDVVIEGTLNADGIFRATEILTKCPSKYVPKK